MGFFEVNFLAVIVAAVASMALGFVWYGPLFGKQWMKLTGKKMEDMKKGSATNAYIGSFVAAIVTAFVLANLLALMPSKALADGALGGFMAWLGFVVTTNSMEVFFGGRKVNLFALDMGYQLVSLVLMGLVIAFMG